MWIRIWVHLLSPISPRYCYFFFHLSIELLLGLFPYPPPPIGCLLLHCPVENLYNLLTKCFIPRVLKAGVWNVGEQEDSFTCLCLCRDLKGISSSKAKRAMRIWPRRGIWRRLAGVFLIFTLFILTNCNRNCSTTVKYWKNMAFFQKHFSPFRLETNRLLNHWFIDI